MVGYEANGGFLTASPIPIGAHQLAPLPTRDTVIVHLAILGLSLREAKSIAQLLAELPQRFTASDRLNNFPTAISRRRLAALLDEGPPAIQRLFPALGDVAAIDTTDGVRITFTSGDIIHLRPSGNAPELRCYAEADTEARATALVREVLARLEDRREERRGTGVSTENTECI